MIIKFLVRELCFVYYVYMENVFLLFWIYVVCLIKEYVGRWGIKNFVRYIDYILKLIVK